jgi:hypothetical protein
MPFNIGGLSITSTTSFAPDGSSSSNPARSGLELARNYPNKSSGLYWIQSEKMPNPLQMYVDMTEDGGGYDFYPITAGPSIQYYTSTHGGTPLGLDLVYPRSKYHWRAMANYIRNYRGDTGANYQRWFQTTYAVTSTTAGNYTSEIMRNGNFYGTGTTSWTVPDGGRWWLRDTTFGEPNGDYTPNSFLWFASYGAYTMPEPYNLEDLGFNDYPVSGGYATGNYYLVSTNLKG